MTGTGLDIVSAGGGMAGGSEPDADFGPIVPGSAVSLQLVRGDMEIAATCTVTYVDPKQLLACGHPVSQAGPVSLPMTSAEVVATLPSPLNAFKIVNTGRVIGAFTEDRETAIRGELGATARMIPVSISVAGSGRVEGIENKLQVLDLPSLTPSRSWFRSSRHCWNQNQSTAETSYHVTGQIKVHGQTAVPVDAWGVPGEATPPQLAAALGVAESFNRLYANATRQEPMESVRLHIEAIPKNLRTELESVRLISSSIVHAGDTVEVEATLRPWEQPARNMRMRFAIPARLQPGTLRVLIAAPRRWTKHSMRRGLQRRLQANPKPRPGCEANMRQTSCM